MRILHIIKSIDTDLGGPPRSTVGLCRALAQAGHDVTLLTADATGWNHDDLNMNSESVRFRTIVSKAIVSRGKELILENEIVHMQSVWSPVNIRLARFCRKLGIPYVLSPRGELDVWSMKQKGVKKQIFLGLVGRRMIDGAAALHLLNEEERNGLEPLDLEGRCFVVPNGIDPEEWLDAASNAGIGASNGESTVLFMARLHHKKGPLILAKAFSRIAEKHPESRLSICGPDFGERELVKEHIESEGLSDRVECPGMVSGDDRLRRLRNAAVFVLPSQQEGHPRNVLEAAIMGKAMIITPECHCPEFADGESAIVVSPDEGEVADALDRLLADSDLRRTLGESAKTTVLDNYAWQSIAPRMANHYHRCLDDRDALTAL